LLDDNIT